MDRILDRLSPSVRHLLENTHRGGAISDDVKHSIDSLYDLAPYIDDLYSGSSISSSEFSVTGEISLVPEAQLWADHVKENYHLESEFAVILANLNWQRFEKVRQWAEEAQSHAGPEAGVDQPGQDSIAGDDASNYQPKSVGPTTVHGSSNQMAPTAPNQANEKDPTEVSMLRLDKLNGETHAEWHEYAWPPMAGRPYQSFTCSICRKPGIMGTSAQWE